MGQVVPGAGGVDTISIAGLVLPVSGLIMLTAHTNTGASVGKCTFRKWKNSSGGYTPSGSKKFRLCAIRSAAAAVSAVALFGFLGETTNDVGYMTNTALAGDSGFFIGANAATSVSYLNNFLFGGALESPLNPRIMEFAFGPNNSNNTAEIANTKYLTVVGNSSANGLVAHIAFGYEV